MPGARAYLEGWRSLLKELGPADVTIDASPQDDQGLLVGTVSLDRGFRLVVWLRLDDGHPIEIRRYALQLLDTDSAQVLRYDNSPRHSNLPGAPHHRHLQAGGIEPVIPAPSLRVMLAAIKNEIG